MNIEILQEFLFWCMIINFGIYTLTAIAVLVFRDVMYKIHKMMFGLDEETVSKSIHMYLASYKFLITFFNFVPWVAILIIK
ncbi:DUF6868 family protein [Sulfurovum sp. CS9]|uniref:DUF6868 family protein n=1 Tax=Sulfurovum sp. CS9 TaxID=3391146 RepID=UPI0039ED2326